MSPKNNKLFNISSIHRNRDFRVHSSNKSGKDFEVPSARKRDYNLTGMQRVQEKAEKQKVAKQATAELSATEIVKALEEHIDSVVALQKGECEFTAEATQQVVWKLRRKLEHNKKIQIFASRLADGQVIYHVVDLRKASENFDPGFIDIKHVPGSNAAIRQSDAAGVKEPVQLPTPDEVARSVEDPGLQHALKFGERLRTGESRALSPEESEAMWEETDRQMEELEGLVAHKFGGPKL